MARLTAEQTLLLGKIPDAELGEKVGVTRERIRQIRTEKNIEKFSKIPKKEKIILDYVKGKKEICISALKNETGIFQLKNQPLTIEVVKNICAKNDVVVIFKIENQIRFDHSYYKYRANICRCDICKLANCTYAFAYRNFDTTNYFFTNKFANDNFKLYKNDKDQFYEKFTKEYNEYLLSVMST